MNDLESEDPVESLGRVAKAGLQALGEPDYASVLGARARRDGWPALRAPIGIAAALIVGLGLGGLVGAALGAAYGAANGGTARSDGAALGDARDEGAASSGEEMRLFLDELMAGGDASDYALLIDWE